MTFNALAPFVYKIQEGINQFDLRSWLQTGEVERFFSTIDYKTIGWMAVASLAIIFVLNFFTRSIVPFGRNFAVSAADAWQRNRDVLTFDKSGRSSRTLEMESLVEVLDSLADAVKKWEGRQDIAFTKSGVRFS
ncbi:hypothetical protein SK128_020708 [Halocaridina rubra]|uniref:Uncharacterized protein n=1 Tax=Halocaridina rubra TaxID=373956 RepID=A0AAN9AGU8_HALRR